MSTKGYIPKNLTFDSKGRQKLIQGISKISKAVKSTLGPRGKTVLIESPDHVGGITITKDGVTVAKNIFLDDPVENLAIQMMKDASNRTSSVAGDGTTTAIVLTEAIIKAGSIHLTEEDNVTEVIKHINSLTDTIVAKLKKEAKKITKSRLLDVATLSVNNDREIGRIIGDAYGQVGNDGIVTVEKSMTAATYAEVTNGIKIDRGYTSNLFINNQRKDECVLEDVQVLVCDTEITNILQIENVLKPIIQERKQFLIIGPCSTNVVNTLAANVLRNGLKICNITPPNFGYKQHELMQDIALTLGATYFSEKTGDDLSLITPADLGHADKIIVNNDSSVIIKHQEMSEKLKTRVAELKEQQSNATIKQEKDFINERIASLSGAIGCIYVGGNSDVEQKEKFDRVDDSVCAVRSALEEGIIPGGGLPLLKISHDLKKILTNNIAIPGYKEWVIARSIICDGIESPFRQIIKNSGKDYEVIEKKITLSKKKNYGYDVKKEIFGDMYKMGIIDPLKVTRNALINAVSVATTILSTNAIITHARIKE